MTTVNQVRTKLRKLNHPMFTTMANKFQDGSMRDILNNYNELKPLWEATLQLNKMNKTNSVSLADNWFSAHLLTQQKLHGSLSRPLIIMNYATAKLIGGSIAVAADKVLTN